MKKHKQQAFTIIETLVSLLIISVGILGFALLQVESLKASQNASQRSKAIHFANDILDRIRANSKHTPGILTASGVNSSPYQTTLGGAGAAPKVSCSITNNNTIPNVNTACTPIQMANYEVWQWRSMIEDPQIGFVGGKAGINVQLRDVTNPASASVVTVTIQWSEKSPTPKTFVLNSVIPQSQN